MKFGSGSFTYEVLEGWAQLPPGWDMVEVPGIAVDSKDQVYLFSRSEHPVMVFGREGEFLGSWGEGVFTRPHGFTIGPDDFLYCVDDLDHTLRKCTPEGKVLMTIGVPGQPSDTGYVMGNHLSVKRAGPPFNRPTNVALSAQGDIYVTDGYGNARVHRFSPEGRLLTSWGQPGGENGQFRLVHGIAVDAEGLVYVGDRMNNRIQVFTPDGEFLTLWPDVYQPNDLVIDPQGNMVIAECGYNRNLPIPGPIPNPGEEYARVTVRNLKGEVLARIFNPDPRAPGGFFCTHAARLDSHGDLYVGEVCVTAAKNMRISAKGLHPMQKFVRVRA